ESKGIVEVASFDFGATRLRSGRAATPVARNGTGRARKAATVSTDAGAEASRRGRHSFGGLPALQARSPSSPETPFVLSVAPQARSRRAWSRCSPPPSPLPPHAQAGQHLPSP